MSSTDPPPPLLYSIPLLSLCGSLVFFSVFERIINAALSVLWHFTIGFKESDGQDAEHRQISQLAKAYSHSSAVQLVVSLYSSASKVATSTLNALLSAIASMITWLLLALAIIALAGFLYLAYENYPPIARGFVLQYNLYIGPQLHAFLVLPVEAAKMFLGAFLPLYNTFSWISIKLVKHAFTDPVISSPVEIFRFSTSAGRMVKTSADSLLAYTTATALNCNPPINQSIADPSPTSSTCVSDVGIRTLDLITPISHLRDAVAILVGWIGSSKVCAPLALPLDILIAPLMDINFAKAVHNLVNAVLWLVLQLPIVTEKRCRIFSGIDDEVAMCLPDFEPVFRCVYFLFDISNSTFNIDFQPLAQSALRGPCPDCENACQAEPVVPRASCKYC